MTESYPPTWQYGATTDGAHAAADVPVYDAPVYDAPVYDAPVYDQETPPSDDEPGKAGAAKEQAAAVGQGAAQAGQQVASVAKDQAQNVAAEAGSQAKDLVGQARSELTEQAGIQQKRLAETLRSLGDELKSMAGHDGEKSTATDLVSQASGRTHDVASWLESREPGHLLSDVQGFARQRPGAFLALAAAAGVVVGRLGRGVKDSSGDDAPAATSESTPTPATYADATPATYGDTTYVDAVPAATDFGGSGTDEPRPFASSQDAGYETYPNEGSL